MQYKNLKNIKAENQRNRQSERLKNDYCCPVKLK